MGVYLFFMALVFGPPLLAALAPRALLGTTVGWAVLGIGLLWLDERNIPFAERGLLGGSGVLFGAWGLVLAVATLIRLGATHGAASDDEQGRDAGERHVLLGWQLPVAVLAAICFLHWLGNRLAGFEPAWAAHAAILLTGAVGAAVLRRVIARWPFLRAGWRRSRDPRA